MICESIGYEIGCCGLLNRFQYYTKADGDIEMMIWRPVGESKYQMIVSVSDTVSGLAAEGGELIT